MTDQVQLANLIAKNFIARADAKAKQYPDGEYKPVRVDPRDMKSATVPWSRDDVLAHLAGTETFGHYFLDHNSTTKLFAFDIDLEKVGMIPSYPAPDPATASEDEFLEWEQRFAEGSPREAWRNRGYFGRSWMKYEFRTLAGMLADKIHSELQIQCAVAYSGSKGVHVYGFTGRQSADNARAGAELVLELIGGFERDKRASTWKHKDKWRHMSIEVYPKQIALSDGGFGNLMRLPLGKNTKSPDPTFFVDLNAPMNELRPADPLWSLTAGLDNPWSTAQ